MVGISKFKRNEESLGFLLNKWDNQLDNTVAAFESMFNAKLGHNKDLEVEIGEIFTTDGRYITIGDEKIAHMFKEDGTIFMEQIVYDVLDLNDNLIRRYQETKAIEAAYGVSGQTVRMIIRGKAPNNRLQIKINKIDLGEENGTIN